jgi:hypothetical protein
MARRCGALCYAVNMLDAPRQNWELYESLSRSADAAWIRGLTLSQRLEIYSELFNLVWQARDPAADNDRLEQQRWQEKLMLRKRLSEAFAQWDQQRRDQSAPNHTA